MSVQRLNKIRFWGDRDIRGAACRNPQIDHEENQFTVLLNLMGHDAWKAFKKKFGIRKFIGAGSYAWAFLGKGNHVFKLT